MILMKREMFRVWSASERRGFQYVPILNSLHKVLEKKEVQGFVFSSEGHVSHFMMGYTLKPTHCYQDMTQWLLLCCMWMNLTSVTTWNIQKKHQVTAVYWVLANVPSLLRPSLPSVYLASLCEAL
ncbi:hypothetical protein NFI96_028485 [Prochilodus magdalenae]|nr:hypothetical protein NFI96_028485 [Prochilodus magdalenae]